MSSINPHYTFEYSQPDEYRFSHDSVFLARRIFEITANRIKPEWKILDLCAGSGIVGLDFLFHCRSESGLLPAKVDFLELQTDYKGHFEINVRRLDLPMVQVRLLQMNYADLVNHDWAKGHYDLILCNPPYFDLGSGKLSENEFKNRCRFFLDADKQQLIKSIRYSLALQGEAYVLMREVPEELENVGEIRGTPLVRITQQFHS